MGNIDYTQDRQARVSRRAALGLMGAGSIVGLSACGRVRESRLNPLNWFGRSQEEEPTLAPREGYDPNTDPRPVVQQVTALQVDRVPGGALVTATGLPPTQGHWSAGLVAEATGASGRPLRDGSTLAFEFRLLPPQSPQPSGPAQSRELTATVYLTDQDMQGVRTITVKGLTNQRSARR